MFYKDPGSSPRVLGSVAPIQIQFCIFGLVIKPFTLVLYSDVFSFLGTYLKMGVGVTVTEQ